MIGGKPVTVQMAGGGNKTLTFVQPPQGKIVRLPVTTSIAQGVNADQPKLVVVPRPKQPSTIASTSFDSPATTDAALAALAAEAGLIDPEPNKDTPPENSVSPDAEQMSTDKEDKTGNEVPIETEGVAPAVGLYGGANKYSKFKLKGGSMIRLGLFGGSPISTSTILPPKSFTYRGGLFGGSKDSPESSQSQESVSTEDSGIQSLNGIVKSKSEDGCDLDDMKMEIESDATKSENNLSDVKMDSNTEQPMDTNCEKVDKVKEDTGDALSALASAALDHSKDTIKTENPVANVKDPKDTWYTVGFIKGTSCDVRNYFLFEEDSPTLNEDALPETSHLPRINLEPGTAYKFRVAALNSVGRGDWSEVIYKILKNHAEFNFFFNLFLPGCRL